LDDTELRLQINHCFQICPQDSLFSVCFYSQLATNPQIRSDCYQKFALYNSFTYLLTYSCFRHGRYTVVKRRRRVNSLTKRQF